MSDAYFLTASGGLPWWTQALALVPFAVLGLLWMIVGATVALKGGEMEKPNRVAQLYGYTVCLVATLRVRYDALVADGLATTRYRTTKTLVTSSVLVLIAIALFAFHWRWVRRFTYAAEA